jgi:hypothetical protein
MKKYGVLEDILKREFKSVGIFSRESSIPKSTLSMLIHGRYGSSEVRVRERIAAAIKKLRPNLDLKHIWDPSFIWHEEYLSERSAVKNGFKIIIDVKLNDEGQLTVAPFVEGY